MPISDIEFGDRLRRARKARGLSQKVAAELLHTEQTRISEYERGIRVPPLPRLMEIVETLRLDPSILFPEWFENWEREKS